MITLSQFTTDFPEFVSPSQGQFNLFANLASLMLTPAWGLPGPDSNGHATQYDYGSELFIAHNLALGMQAQKQAAGGGIPGMSRGVISSESAGPLSVGYDANAGIEEGAGHWNLTTYGQRFIQMLRLIGAAPTVSSPGGCINPLNGPAWAGNWQVPGGFA